MWFTDYWAWIVPLSLLVGYELNAIWTQFEAKRAAGSQALPTLSQLVWRAQRAWPPLRWIVLGTLAVLAAHFFFGGG